MTLLCGCLAQRRSVAREAHRSLLLYTAASGHLSQWPGRRLCGQYYGTFRYKERTILLRQHLQARTACAEARVPGISRPLRFDQGTPSLVWEGLGAAPKNCLNWRGQLGEPLIHPLKPELFCSSPRESPGDGQPCRGYCFGTLPAPKRPPSFRLPLSSREVERCSSGDTESSEFAEDAFEGVSEPDSHPVSGGTTSLPGVGSACAHNLTSAYLYKY